MTTARGRGTSLGDVELSNIPEEEDGVDEEVSESKGTNSPSSSKGGDEDVETVLPRYVPSHGQATTLHKFWAVLKFQVTLKDRKFKHASGALVQYILALFINVTLLLLCLAIRTRMGDPIEVSQQVSYACSACSCLSL